MSLRLGQVETDFDSGDLLGPGGQGASYELRTGYRGLHAGVGYVFRPSQSSSFELNGKYLWNRQKGKGVTLSSGDRVEFGSVDSSRVRAGGRYSLKASEFLSPYAGAAYERELDGRAEAMAYGRKLPEPRLKGSTGLAELGLSLKAAESFLLDIGVQGHFGRREGVTGSLQLKFVF
jgi:hypothetical protein